MTRTRQISSMLGTLCLAVLAIVATVCVVPSLSITESARTTIGTVPTYFAFGLIVIDAKLLNGLRTSFRAIFNNAIATAPSVWAKVAMKIPSGSGQNTYAWLGQATRFREWLGDRIIQNLEAHGFTIVNKRYENTVGVKADDIKDDNIGVYTPLIQQLANDSQIFYDELLFDLIKNAHQTKCYDGQNFFDTDHPIKRRDGTDDVVSNYQAGANPLWVLMDATKPIKPFIVQDREAVHFDSLDNPDDVNVFMKNQFLYGATLRGNVGLGLWQLAFGSRDVLNAANYEDARVALRGMEADNGKKLNVTPSLLLVGPSLEGAANALIKAQKDAAGADNIWFGTAEVVVVPWLE